MTEFNPTSGRVEARRVGGLSIIAILAFISGGVLIALNVMVMEYVINKERVFAERESQNVAADLKIQQRRFQLDSELSTESRLNEHITELQTQIGKKQADLDSLKSKIADQQAINSKIDAIRVELNGDEDAAKKAVADKATAEAARDAAKGDLARANDQRDATRADLKNLTDEQATLIASINDLSQKKTAIEQDTKKAEAKFAALRENIASTSTSLEGLQADAQRAAGASKAAQQAATTALLDQQTADKRRDAANQEAVHADDLRKQTDELAGLSSSVVRRPKMSAQSLQQAQTLKSSIATSTQQKRRQGPHVVYSR